MVTVVDQWYFPVAVEESLPRSETVTARSHGRRGVRATSLVLGAVLIVSLYWWWPGIMGRGENHDASPAVVVVGGGQLSRSEEKVLRRLREEGYSATWGGSPADWCELSEMITDLGTIPTRAVVLYAPSVPSECDEASVVADRVIDGVETMDVRVLVVVGLEGGDRDDPVVLSLIDRGVTIVDPTSLIGEPTVVRERVDCLWWDDCVFEGVNPGYVIVWDENGLTAAGQQRVARLIVATVQ